MSNLLEKIISTFATLSAFLIFVVLIKCTMTIKTNTKKGYKNEKINLINSHDEPDFRCSLRFRH